MRIVNVLKTQVIRTVFSTRFPNSQRFELQWNDLHAPVYQSIQLIYQRDSTHIIAYQRSSALYMYVKLIK